MNDYVSWLRGFVGQAPLLLVAAGVIVRDESDRILLQRRTDDGSWGIPGGGLEPGETLEQTARRELLEETGLTAGELRLVEVHSGPDFFLTYPNGDQAHVVSATFTTRSVEGDPVPDGDETTELRYFPIDDLPAGLNAFNRRLLERCIGKL